MTHYQTLGVSHEADRDVIHAAYLVLAKKFHPDKPGGSEAKMREVNEAHRVLYDEALRREYDRSIAPKPIRASRTRTKAAYHPAYRDPYTGADAFVSEAENILRQSISDLAESAIDNLLGKNLSPKMREAVSEVLKQRRTK